MREFSSILMLHVQQFMISIVNISILYVIALRLLISSPFIYINSLQAINNIALAISYFT